MGMATVVTGLCGPSRYVRSDTTCDAVVLSEERNIVYNPTEKPKAKKPEKGSLRKQFGGVKDRLDRRFK